MRQVTIKNDRVYYLLYFSGHCLFWAAVLCIIRNGYFFEYEAVPSLGVKMMLVVGLSILLANYIRSAKDLPRVKN